MYARQQGHPFQKARTDACLNPYIRVCIFLPPHPDLALNLSKDTRMSPITDLPTELLEYIVLDLESCDAVNLAQTCKTLHTVALPAAYNTITLLWDNTSEDDEDGGTVDG